MRRAQQEYTEYASAIDMLEEMEQHGAVEVQRQSVLARYLNFQTQQKGVPMHGTFELTPFCNLNCKMCYVHLNRNQVKASECLGAEQWKHLIDQAVEAGMMDAVLTGGECLTFPAFDEVYLHLQEKGIRVSVLTNGTLLSSERVSFFKKHPPRGIQISLYGENDDVYEAVTGSRCFDMVMNGVRRIQEAGIPASIAITPNRYLKDNGVGLLSYVHSLGMTYTVNTMLFQPRKETGRDGHDDISVDEYIQLQVLKRKLQGSAVIPVPECELPPSATTGESEKGLKCGGGKNSFFIDWRGSMHPCANLMDIESHPLQDGFLPAWQKIRDAVTEYPLPAECPKCVYRNVCPACPAAHRQGAEVGHASPYLCERARKIVAAGLSKI